MVAHLLSAAVLTAAFGLILTSRADRPEPFAAPRVTVDGTAEVRFAGDDVFVSSGGEVSFVTLTWKDGVARGATVRGRRPR